MPSFIVGAELPTSAPKIWQTLKDAPLIIPKIAPHAVSSIEHLDGPAEGVGSVRLTKLGTAAPPGAFVKEKLVAFDPAAFTATTEEIEGGHLGQGFTKWLSNVRLTPISDCSCNWETTVEYEGGNDAAIGPAVARAKVLLIGESKFEHKFLNRNLNFVENWSPSPKNFIRQCNLRWSRLVSCQRIASSSHPL